MKELILIPDVHGRTFWKEVIPYVKGGTPCIFLGDYTDPYPFEGISNLNTLNNLRDILTFARSYSDRVTLLLGNHDLSYLGDPPGIWSVYANRLCYEYYDLISEYLNENTDLLSLCAFHEVGGKTFLFSHAGLHPLWLAWSGLFDDINDPQNGKALAEKIDHLYRESHAAGERTEFIEALAMISSVRGGDAFAGSPVWADVSEFADTHTPFSQIFGHTMQIDGIPYRVGNNICIDCRRSFYLDHHATLRNLDDDTLVFPS